MQRKGLHRGMNFSNRESPLGPFVSARITYMSWINFLSTDVRGNGHMAKTKAREAVKMQK